MSLNSILDALKFPLRTSSALVIAVFCVLLWLSQQAGMLGIPLLLIVVSWFFKYSFVLLDYVVDGKSEPPTMSSEMMNPVEQRPFGMLLLMILFFLAMRFLQPLVGTAAVVVLWILWLALVPAMVGAMSITGRFIDALNPVAVFGLIARMPATYALLLLTIALLWSVPTGLMAMTGLADLLPGMLATALWMYLWLAMCACIGRAIFEERDALGYDAVESPERTAAKEQAELDRERDKIMDGIFAEVRGGALGNAGQQVRKLIDNAPAPLDHCRWIYRRAAAWPDQRLANYVAQLTLPRLLAARATGEALNLLRERLQRDAHFRPQSAGQLVQLAQLARVAGDLTTARLALADFDRHFPNDAAKPLVDRLQTELAR